MFNSRRSSRLGRKKKKRDEIEPLKTRPDYSEQRKRGLHQAAINLNRVYFVDENYRRLIISKSEVRRGGNPIRFVGQLPYIPEKGDVLSTEDFSDKFIVLRRHLVPNLSLNLPPKIYIVLKEIKNS
jgi:hypothetical protein